MWVRLRGVVEGEGGRGVSQYPSSVGSRSGGGEMPQGHTVRLARLPAQDRGPRGREPVISFHRISQRPAGQFNFQMRWQCKLTSMKVSKV